MLREAFQNFQTPMVKILVHTLLHLGAVFLKKGSRHVNNQPYLEEHP